jgi:hypothetical protein
MPCGGQAVATSEVLESNDFGAFQSAPVDSAGGVRLHPLGVSPGSRRRSVFARRRRRDLLPGEWCAVEEVKADRVADAPVVDVAAPAVHLHWRAPYSIGKATSHTSSVGRAETKSVK